MGRSRSTAARSGDTVESVQVRAGEQAREPFPPGGDGGLLPGQVRVEVLQHLPQFAALVVGEHVTDLVEGQASSASRRTRARATASRSRYSR